MATTENYSSPYVLEDTTAAVALRVYTMYFIVVGVTLGMLLFTSARVTARIYCWRCMYGSDVVRYDKADPRLPASLFRSPSVLTSLQDRYDKSYDNTIKSSASSRRSAIADVEAGNKGNTPDVHLHRHQDELVNRSDHTGFDATVTVERVSIAEHPDAIDRDDILDEGSISGRKSVCKSSISDYCGTWDSSGSTNRHHNVLCDDKVPGDNNMISDRIEEEPEVDVDTITRDKMEAKTGHIMNSKYDEEERSNQGYTYPRLGTPDSIRQDAIELQNMGDIDSGTMHAHSLASVSFTTEDDVPLVDFDQSDCASTSDVGGRSRRYKKNVSQSSTGGTSTRTASAKSSKRYQRHY